jgi:hypothetical protein
MYKAAGYSRRLSFQTSNLTPSGGFSVSNVGVMEYWNDGCGGIRPISLICPYVDDVILLFQ